jgi:hypothetical protein
MTAVAAVARSHQTGGGKRGFSPAMDAQIDSAYRAYTRRGGRRAIVDCVKKLGVAAWKVHRRAQFLGLARASEQPWSEAEVEILRENRFYSNKEIQRRMRVAGFTRSEMGILLKRKRLNLTTRNHEDGYTANALAGLLNVDAHGVTRWIHKGILRADMRETTRTDKQHGDGYWIRAREVRAFVFRFPEEIDLRKVDPVWFIALLRGGEIGEACDEEYF